MDFLQKEYKKSNKNQNHVFGKRIYLSRPESKLYPNRSPPPFNKLKSTSLIFDKLGESTRTEPSHDISDSCTQTSKTILQLANLESGNLTPDSLMSSPRSPKLFNTLNNQEVETKLEISLHHSDMPSNCTLDSSVNVEQPVVPQFMRKSSLQRYLNNNEPTKTIPLEDEVTKYTKPSLREAFLAKKQSNEASICHCRSRFLQQTSPLRNLPPESQKKTNKFLRSYSYVEENPNFLPEYMEEERKLPQVSRFTVKSIKEQVYSNRASPVKYYNLDNIESPRILTSHISRFEEIKSPYYSPRQNRSRRSTSFMSPTIASQQRNQQYMVETVKKLISPTRHGKSISPECNLTEIIDPKHIRNKKVPYIDQSKSHVEMRKPEKNSSSIKSRNHVETMEKTISAKTMFDEDLLNIDLLSLEIKTSEVFLN